MQFWIPAFAGTTRKERLTSKPVQQGRSRPPQGGFTLPANTLSNTSSSAPAARSATSTW